MAGLSAGRSLHAAWHRLRRYGRWTRRFTPLRSAPLSLYVTLPFSPFQ